MGTLAPFRSLPFLRSSPICPMLDPNEFDLPDSQIGGAKAAAIILVCSLTMEYLAETSPTNVPAVARI